MRFLHVVDRRVAETATQPTVEGGVPSGERFVEELRVGEQVYRPWEEAVEREIVIGGSEGDPWPEVLALQAGSGGKRRFEGLDGEMLVRGADAYVPDGVASPWSPLAERVRLAFDPQGTLA